jgi:hypothetical protein
MRRRPRISPRLCAPIHRDRDGGARSGEEVNMLRIETVELPLVPASAVYKGL